MPFALNAQEAAVVPVKLPLPHRRLLSRQALQGVRAMKPGSRSLLCAALSILAAPVSADAPQVVWEAPTPNSLANSLQGIGWAPGTVPRVAVGSTDRWVRARKAGNGVLVYSVLQPHRSGSANQVEYSTDGQYLAVHNSSGGLGYRVHRAADGVFLGMLTVTLAPSGLMQFAADAQLIGATGGDGTLSRWQLAKFTVVRVVGSGYDKVTTTYHFSPDGAYQAAASRGSITIQSRQSAAVVSMITGGTMQGVAPMQFTPDGTRLAAWSNAPNEVDLFRVADGLFLRRFPGAASNEGVGAIRFSPDGTRLVTSGYLPYQTPNGWAQKGVIRFWRVADAALRRVFDARTGIAVTSPVAWSPDAARFAYGTYEGTAVAALTPAP
jgi:WD40 repeat protein